MKKLLTLFLAVILIIQLLPVYASAANEKDELVLTGTVTGTQKLHMRSSPSTDASVITDLKSGATVEVLQNDGNWCYVSKNGRSGYVMTRYLNIKPNYKHLAWGWTEDKDAILVIYEKADTASRVIDYFYSGARFEVISEEGSWKKIRLGKNIGYFNGEVQKLPEDKYGLAVFSDNTTSYKITFDNTSFLSRALGDELTVSGSQGANTYRFTYPVTGFEKIDSTISLWMKKQRDALPQNSTGHLQINYESYLTMDRYAGFVLYAQYKDEFSSCENILGINLDTATGALVSADQLFTDTLAPSLILDSRIASFLLEKCDGYDLDPDVTWFKNAVITPSGLQIYLKSGSFLPDSLGTQKITLEWHEVANSISDQYDIVEKRIIDPTGKMICFTFDDGPSEQTERILDCLLQYGGHATFCVQGRWVADYAATIKRTVAEGNEIASHTYSHKKLTELSSSNAKSQITRVEEEVQKIIPGYKIKWLRCPYGSTNKTVKNICKSLDMSIAFWQIDTLDWSTRNADATYRTIMKEVRNGAIILCHDIYSTTADAVIRAIPDLIEQGYQLVTLSEMFQYLEGGPVPGTVYTCLKEEDNAALKK